MKKLGLLICLMLSLLSGCFDNNIGLTILTQFDKLAKATYVESKIYFHIKTSEMDLAMEPQLLSKTLKTDNGTITSLKYDSPLLYNLGLFPFELIVDETTSKLYLLENNAWTKVDISELFINNTSTDAEVIVKINDIFNNLLMNFHEVKFIGNETFFNNKELKHYQLKINLLLALNELYDLLNEESGNQLISFDVLLQELSLKNIINVFKDIKLDVYYDESSNTVARVHFDIMQIFSFLYQYQSNFSAVFKTDFNFNFLGNYFQEFEIGITYDNINTQNTIEISDYAKMAEEIKFDQFMNRFINNYPVEKEEPIITLNGSNKTILLGQSYIELGATALDDQDGDLSKKIITNVNVNSDVIGSYTVTYKVTDSDGNTSYAYRNVDVILDPVHATDYPILTLNGSNEINLYVGDEYHELGASAFDNTDGDLTQNIKITNDINNQIEGKYLVKYEVEDSYKKQTTKYRTVNVINRTIEMMSNDIIPTSSDKAIMHPNKPIIYMINTDRSILSMYNFETKDFSSITFKYQTKDLKFYNNKIYVALANSIDGAFAIVNSDNIDEYIMYYVASKPEHININNYGYIFISPKFLFSPNFDLLSSNYNAVSAKYNSLLDRFYHRGSSSQYSSKTNSFSSYNYNYNYTYNYGTNHFISSDGKYVFTNNGQIFNCDALESNDYKKAAKTIPNFIDIAFSTDRNEFYILIGTYFYVYNLETLSHKSMIYLDTNYNSIYYKDNALYFLGYEANSTRVMKYSLN